MNRDSAHRPVTERPLVLQCGQDQLVSIMHMPSHPKKQAVLIIVGGPQYRAGGHRYFVTLARALAESGYMVMRFDYRGMGDSDGSYPGFEHLTDDIKTAIDALFDTAPMVENVALWGLCNAASASAFYSRHDKRVNRIMMLNPWARHEAAYDKVLLRHYYARRLFDKGFWRNLLRGHVRLFDFPKLLWKMTVRRLNNTRNSKTGTTDKAASPLARRIVTSVADFNGPVKLVLSGNDLTAKEFEQEVGRIPRWHDITKSRGFSCLRLPQADHTFSEARWSQAVTQATLDWLKHDQT